MSEENVRAVIPSLSRKTGWFSHTAYTLVVTDERMLFVHEDPKEASAFAKEAAAKAKAEGKGFFGRWGAVLSSGYDYVRNYWDMPVEEIAARGKESIAIPLGRLRSVRIIKKLVYDKNQEMDVFECSLAVEHTGEKLTFSLRGNEKNVREALQSALGEVFRA
ncbi:hypothetical protein C8D99_11716 [Aminivibrio pyruvatiphilus]|uniref:Uncharacterized protein n=1 Tax=Aminivibrio pyruvatiphilus TaxID=1005740 RepID=A0A4R8M6B3_9BACT|nr:hypothetical protein [Aminivibrio pyruvatiphilus]TDY56715.1 hypothetical protein C8D99_11716 [Aminivibrio pyruvatiphilus]